MLDVSQFTCFPIFHELLFIEIFLPSEIKGQIGQYFWHFFMPLYWRFGYLWISFGTCALINLSLMFLCFL